MTLETWLQIAGTWAVLLGAFGVWKGGIAIFSKEYPTPPEDEFGILMAIMFGWVPIGALFLLIEGVITAPNPPAPSQSEAAETIPDTQ